MALQVWLPLNGDLKNKGCANVTVTNNGATVDNNGKIGKCYKFTADSNNIKINNFMPILKNYNNYSLCAWIYMTSAATNHSTTILSSGNWNTTNANFVLALYNYSSGYTKLLVPNTRSWNTVSINLSNKLIVNTWYHIAVTYNGTTTTAYVNGEIIGSASSGGICENSDSDNVRIGGATYYDGFTLKGNINDVRIYDNCLSAAEVKEISRGLVLHYKLDDPVVSLKFYDYIQSDGNSYIDTGVNPKIKPRVIANLAMLNDADKDYWGNSAINGSAYYANFYTRNLRYYRYGSTTARNVNYTVDLNTWHTWDVSKEVYVDGNLKYTSPDTYTYNSSQASIQIFKAARSTYYSAYKLKYFKLYDGDALVRDFVPCECNGIPGLWDWVENKFYSNLGSGTLTLGTEINSNTTIIDSSGYNNHGAITGNLTSSNETSRYNSSILFNGINSCITIPYKQINPSGIFTMNLWFKKDSLGTKNYETLFGGPSGFEMDTRANNASTLSLYMDSTRGGNVFSPFNFGEWYMVTMVRDGTNEFYYINGELKKTIGAKSMPNGTYFIGAWKTSTQQNYCGYISDFRLYCTTLSAEDIKQLYEVSAKIDNLGNFHTYEFVENENNKIEKVGVSDFNLKERTGIASIYKQVNPNLLQGTEIDSYRYERTSGMGTEFGKRFTPTQQLETGTYYTFSAMIRGNANMNLYTINTGGNISFQYANKEDMDENEFKLFSVTFRVTGNRTIDQIYPCSRYGESNTLVGDWYEVQENSVKLEEGSSCTPWIPAETDENYRNYNGMLVANQFIEI